MVYWFFSSFFMWEWCSNCSCWLLCPLNESDSGGGMALAIASSFVNRHSTTVLTARIFPWASFSWAWLLVRSRDGEKFQGTYYLALWCTFVIHFWRISNDCSTVSWIVLLSFWMSDLRWFCSSWRLEVESLHNGRPWLPSLSLQRSKLSSSWCRRMWPILETISSKVKSKVVTQEVTTFFMTLQTFLIQVR